MKILNNFPKVPRYFYTSDTIPANSLQKLRRVLEENGVEKEDINEVITIVQVEKPDPESRQLGERANNWILKVFGKVIHGVGRINRDLTVYSLATFIKQYYNLY